MMLQLWFDVGIKRYTTTIYNAYKFWGLWFDVGIKRYTTKSQLTHHLTQLWFDVGIKRYTTIKSRRPSEVGCGLMQESKDIQR